MSDIVDRLLTQASSSNYFGTTIYDDAAAEISRLRAMVGAFYRAGQSHMRTRVAALVADDDGYLVERDQILEEINALPVEEPAE